MITIWQAILFGAAMLLLGLLLPHWRDVMAVDDEKEGGK